MIDSICDSIILITYKDKGLVCAIILELIRCVCQTLFSFFSPKYIKDKYKINPLYLSLFYHISHW